MAEPDMPPAKKAITPFTKHWQILSGSVPLSSLKSRRYLALKMSVTIINAGSQHNVVPATCTFTVDVRVTDAYRNEEVLEIIRQHVKCDVNPRSIRLKP